MNSIGCLLGGMATINKAQILITKTLNTHTHTINAKRFCLVNVFRRNIIGVNFNRKFFDSGKIKHFFQSIH